MTEEQYQKCRENGLFEPMWLDLLNASGFAGVLPNGNLVDRRYFTEAIPVQKNSMFGVSEPKEIPKHSINSDNSNKELSNLIAIQDYLLERGSNDEEINDKIRNLKTK